MSNRLGVHSLVWTGTWTPVQARDALRRTRDAGFQLIELPLSAPEEFEVEATRVLLGEAGIVPRASLALTPATDVSSTDTGTVARGEDLLVRALETVHSLGGDLLCGVLYSALGKYAAPCTPDGYRNAATVVRHVADLAAERGMRLALEVVNRYETNVFNTVAGALRFIDRVDRANVLVHLDTYHMHIEEDGMSAPVHLASGRIGYVHIGESHRGYLGSGNVDFPSFFRALVEAGYDGDITFESFSSAVVDPALSTTLAIWRNLWTDSDDLARHAQAFITSQLTAAQAGLAHD